MKRWRDRGRIEKGRDRVGWRKEEVEGGKENGEKRKERRMEGGKKGWKRKEEGGSNKDSYMGEI